MSCCYCEKVLDKEVEACSKWRHDDKCCVDCCDCDDCLARLQVAIARESEASFIKWSEDFKSEKCYFCSCENDGWWVVQYEDAVCETCSNIWKYDEDDDGYYKIT